jgi:hypothetical protein
MQASMMKRLLVLMMAFTSRAASGADVIDVWNFNSAVDDANPQTGTYLSIHDYGLMGWGQNTTGTLVDGFGSSDPHITDNSAFGEIGYSTDPLGPDKTEGFGFMVDYGGYRDIHLALDLKFSETSVDRLQVQYNLGGNWQDYSVITAQGTAWQNNVDFDFSGLSIANDNPAFEVRFVRLYASPAGFQAPGGGAYGGGTIVFDNARWTGIAVPEPGVTYLLAGGFIAVVIGCVRRERPNHGRAKQ